VVQVVDGAIQWVYHPADPGRAGALAAFLTTGGMPPRAREILGLPWSDRKEGNYQRFAALCRTRAVNVLWERVPMKLRYVPYAREGFARHA
jgi:uncharacterized protein (DUF2236 family)